MTYREFLEAKRAVARPLGFEVEDDAIHPALLFHQRACVRWALRGGRRALFEAFGLGKTVQQLEILRLVLAELGRGRALIVAPLGVRQEFRRDAEMLGIETVFIRRDEELHQAELPGMATGRPVIYLTNYESIRDGKLSPRHFDAVSLDEASCLRGFGGTKTFREFMRLFEGSSIRYRFVATATPSPNEYIELLAYAAFLEIMDVGQAKAQPLDAKVLTPKGWTTMGALNEGDQVIAGDGTATSVLGVYPQGERPIFRVKFSDGSSTECDGDHLWLTHTQYERNNERRHRGRHPGSELQFASVKTTAEIAGTLLGPGGGKNHSIPLVGAVTFTERSVPVDPWLLGALLGDGCLRETNVVLSTADEWVVKTAKAALPDGLALRRTTSDGYDYSITSTGRKGGRGPGSNPLLGALRRYALLGKRAHEKRVPADYLFNSVDVRLGMLRGLMDTDGTVHRDGTMQRFATASPGLAEDVQHLVRSLGGTATVARRTTPGRDAYLVTVRLPGEFNPFALPRKAERVRPWSKYPPARYITAVEPVGTKPAQCIAVEHPDRLYVTDDFAVTHNTRFFKRDSTRADKLTLHPHKEREFWLWVNSWAVFLQRPSDLGFDDAGYELPPLDIRWHEIQTDHSDAGAERDGQARMFRNAAIGVQDAAAEKRRSLEARIAKMMELRAEDPCAHRLLWHDLEDERRAIEKAIPSALTVYGSQDLDGREQAIIDFSDGRIQELAAKPVLAGSGCNFQRHCAWAVFLGVGFKFNDFIQAVHRIHRFLQTQRVRIDIIFTQAEREVVRVLKEKWRRHEEQVATMAEIIRTYHLNEDLMAGALARTMEVERQEVSGPGYRLVLNDACEELPGIESDSVGLIVTSIPFSTQYEYSPSYRDFGHSDDDEHFWQQMDFLIPELLRVLQPGRVAAIHVKDRITPGGVNGLGFQTLSPFSDACVARFRQHGFALLARKTIVTDVVRENNQTYRLGWTEQCKDGSRMGCGVPEYVLLFRKPPTDRSNGYADKPVVKEKPFCDDHGEARPFHPRTNWKRPVPGTGYSRARWQFDAHGFSRSSGDRLLSSAELAALPHEQLYKLWRDRSLDASYDFAGHVAVAEELDHMERLPATFMLLPPHSWHPDVWTDVARMRTLNASQAAAGREMHLCPLQFDIVERLIVQFSMPGELVLDSFAGIGTVPYMAVKLGREALAVELSASYFADQVRYVESAARDASAPSLFDLVDEPALIVAAEERAG